MGLIAILASVVLNLTVLQEGEKLFLENKPQAALPLLEQAFMKIPATNGCICTWASCTSS
jgi:hypothetical protein